MKVCLICIEIFAWGKYGGFGRSTRLIGRELAKRGIEVTAIVPRRPGQKPIEYLDGIRVLGFDSRRPLSAIELIREANADIYHSQEPSFTTYLAQKAMPNRKHIVTFRDTRDIRAWWAFFTHPTYTNFHVILNYLYEDNILVANSVRSADRYFAASHFLIAKSKQKYRLSRDPEFLPSPVLFRNEVKKSATPLACFVGRFDRIKRPHIFFELAQKFQDVEFIAIGAGHNLEVDTNLRMQYGNFPNLKLHGFIDQFQSEELLSLLSQSWVLINVSSRESLPTTFVEAAGHECAILSETNSDNFASRFGYHVQDGDYEKGLKFLLENNRWLDAGRLGAQYVRPVFSVENSIERHINIYIELLR